MQLSFFYITIIAIWLSSCQTSTDKQITYAMQSAGANRSELEKVLEYGQGDSQKQQAARFLIANMPLHKGIDTATIGFLGPLYEKHISISEKHSWKRTREWKLEVDSFWNKEKNRIPFHKLSLRQDIEQVKADWLIREIERSFKAWQENVYAKDCSFEDFCSYILPYRFAEGLCLDDSRDVFYKRHAHIFSDSTKDFRGVTDSLHQLYCSLTHHDWAAASMPLYSAATFEQIKRGSCDDKTWYNCQLMSALGMPVAIDFVPAWGNRSGAHSWNSLIVKGETHPFEPFWDEDRWKYKRIYNNESFDLKWGKFKLPKVYRHTFELHLDGPLGDKSEARENIPALFRNPFMKDVSDQYFKAIDVDLTLTEAVPENIGYCYLCVFGETKWHPVQWGKIRGNKSVRFEKMGKDIVYLPMFCQDGNLIPAGQAFRLNQKGEYQELKCKEEKTDITVRNYTAYLYPEEIAESKRLLVGSCLVGYNDLSASVGDTIYCMTDSMDTWQNDITLQNNVAYRYIRLLPIKDTLGLCELSFFRSEDRNSRIMDIKLSTSAIPINPAEKIEMAVDYLSATGFRGRFRDKGEKEKGVLVDFGKQVTIKCFSFIPYTLNYLTYTPEVELCYWDNRWVSGGILKSDSNFVTFHKIPKGTVYRIKKTNDRIFTYEDGIINWY